MADGSRTGRLIKNVNKKQSPFWFVSRQYLGTGTRVIEVKGVHTAEGMVAVCLGPGHPFFEVPDGAVEWLTAA